VLEADVRGGEVKKCRGDMKKYPLKDYPRILSSCSCSLFIKEGGMRGMKDATLSRRK
jgi:hypothetical protein